MNQPVRCFPHPIWLKGNATALSRGFRANGLEKRYDQIQNDLQPPVEVPQLLLVLQKDERGGACHRPLMQAFGLCVLIGQKNTPLAAVYRRHRRFFPGYPDTGIIPSKKCITRGLVASFVDTDSHYMVNLITPAYRRHTSRTYLNAARQLL